jgi:hypothetical protein
MSEDSQQPAPKYNRRHFFVIGDSPNTDRQYFDARSGKWNSDIEKAEHYLTENRALAVIQEFELAPVYLSFIEVREEQ